MCLSVGWFFFEDTRIYPYIRNVNKRHAESWKISRGVQESFYFNADLVADVGVVRSHQQTALTQSR
jgi:hypothetical protein